MHLAFIFQTNTFAFNVEILQVDAISGENVTFRELLQKSCSLAASLRKAGYGLDTMIGISSENCKEFFFPVLAALFIGGVVVPINNNYTVNEMAHILDITRPEVVFCSQQASQKFIDLKSANIKKIIIIDSNKDEIGNLETINGFIKRQIGGLIDKYNPVDVDAANHVCLILCSSGTTGLPKGVMITDRNISAKNIIDK